MGQYFKLDGITGMLIAVALLLSILAGLTIAAIDVQQREATNYYEITDPLQIKMINSANSNLRVIAN